MANIQSVIAQLHESTLASKEVCLLSLASIFAGYPVLYEGLPGVGKTGLALKFAELLGLSSRRLQCTPDLQPADIIGYLRPAANSESFVMVQGPVFTPCLLVDELNRANPKAQSALLEAMAEGTVTLEGETQLLPPERVILATQNPQDQIGTFPLPESQLDRFGIVLPLGYPDIAKEKLLVQNAFPSMTISSTLDLLSCRRTIHAVDVNDNAADYILRLVQATRQDPQFKHGLSTRGAKVLTDIARAVAWINDRKYVTPDDVQQVFHAVCRHRLISVQTQGSFSNDANLDQLIQSVSISA